MVNSMDLDMGGKKRDQSTVGEGARFKENSRSGKTEVHL